MTSSRRGLLLRLSTAFIVGFVGLSLEIGYTRVISFKLFYYYTYFVIGLALLGLGASSAFTALSRRLRRTDIVDLVYRGAPAAGVVGVISYAIVARLSTDTNLIWAGGARAAAGEVTRLVVLSLSLTAVFFALGLLLAPLIVVEAHHVRRIYFWDLSGAALGCLVAVPLQKWIGPPAMILGSMVLLALLGAAAASVRGRGLLRAAGGVAVVVVLALLAGGLNVRTDATKTLKDSDVTTASEWGAVFRVDAIDLGDKQVLIHDGLWGSSIWRYDGTRATTARFDTDNRQIPFAAVGGDPENLLIIGAAGGNEIQAALTYGVGHVDAVELNPVTVSLLRDTFADYSGNIATNPKVNYVQGDGRTFLARSDQRYDVIWFVAPDSYAASNAATSGAFVLSESYLYTEEMIRTAFDHLTPGGVMVAQFGDFDFDQRPTRTARYLVTARSALSDRVADFSAHTGLVVDRGEAELSRVSTIMLFRSPISPEAVERIDTAVGNVPESTVLHLPGQPSGDGITPLVITLDDADLQRLVDSYPYNISAVTDNQPFFWHFTPFRDVAFDWSRGYEDTEIKIGERLLLLLFGIAAAVAATLLWLPFALTRRRRDADGQNSDPPGRGRLFVYFAALGLGFMLIEISMIQRFALLLGYPTLSLSVSLFTLLIATAVGARYSAWINRLGRRGLPAAAAALSAVTVVYLLVSDGLTETALGWSQPVRIALVFALLFPVGLILGMFLPSGIDRATSAAALRPGVDEGRLVAWCWAVNGFFGVLGSTGATMLSMSFGFERTALVGLLLYVVAATVNWWPIEAEPVPAAA